MVISGFAFPLFFQYFLFCWLVQGFETFPTLPTKPSEIVLRQSRLSANGNNGKFETCSGTGFCNLFLFDTGQYWFYPLLFTFSLEDMCFKLFCFYFSKYSTLIRLDAFTSLTIKSLVLLQVHFPSICYFHKKMNSSTRCKKGWFS